MVSVIPPVLLSQEPEALPLVTQQGMCVPLPASAAGAGATKV